jgi:iron complex outermembrane receptor protein
MKSKFLLALLPAVCLCARTNPIHALQNAADANRGRATGRISGVLKDPSGAAIQGARIEARCPVSHLKKLQFTDRQGQFSFADLPVEACRVTASAAGFETVALPVRTDSEIVASIAMKIERVKAVVEVTEPSTGFVAETAHEIGDADRAHSRNAAELLAETPGASLRENGQLASVPLLHGMGEERVKLVVDGMTLSSACPNHMNPPLSYVASAHASSVSAVAGIVPVSLGGDSLGGTVSIESQPPVFAKPDERLHSEGDSTGFYRGNGQNYGGSASEWVAGKHLGIGYRASWANNDDYADGSGHKVTSTYARTADQVVTLAAQGAGNLLTIEAGLHRTPYEGFVNARMDMVRNLAESLNMHCRRTVGNGALDARIYWQGAWHGMNVGKDKATFPMPMNMPMQTHGRDIGYSVKYTVPLSARHTLQVGNELHRFVLDDRWPAVPGTAPMMGPNTFVGIDNGRRARLGTFAELASKWNRQWTAQLGFRNDTVWTSAGAVQGYSAMYAMDASAFNALDRARTDVNLDATALVRYEPNAWGSYEFGYARKTRSPNLYERYAWSTNWMASGMIGWFGDGNCYVGKIGLKPEIANTVGGTANWHDRARRSWDLKLAPFLTEIQSYIDVDALATATYGMSAFAQLQFANRDARIYGGDLSGSGALWNSERFGKGKIGGVAGWLHSERLDTSTALYQTMPLNLRLNLDEEGKGFSAGMGLQAVDRKSRVDPHRFEQATPGYALLNLHAGYRRGFLQASAGGDNLFNRDYELPLGGVNFDDFMAGGWMGRIKPLTGRGRSLYGSLTARF